MNDGTGGWQQQGGAPLRTDQQVMASSWLRGDSWTVRPADLDANGVSDLLFYQPDTGLWAEGMNVGQTFSFHGGQWYAGWTVATGDLTGDASEDALLYNPTTGEVTEAASVGLGFQLTQGSPWTLDWQMHAAAFNDDELLDVLLYNETTGQWFAAIRGEAGKFAYQTGVWPLGVRLTTELPAELR